MPEAVDAFLALSRKSYFWLDLISCSLSALLRRKFRVKTVDLDLDRIGSLAQAIGYSKKPPRSPSMKAILSAATPFMPTAPWNISRVLIPLTDGWLFMNSLREKVQADLTGVYTEMHSHLNSFYSGTRPN